MVQALEWIQDYTSANNWAGAARWSFVGAGWAGSRQIEAAAAFGDVVNSKGYRVSNSMRETYLRFSQDRHPLYARESKPSLQMCAVKR